jgi:hypothetical protein
MSEKYQCDKCEKEVDFEDVAYLGNESSDCNPFETLECYCKECHET